MSLDTSVDTSAYVHSPADDADLDAWMAVYESGAMTRHWQERVYFSARHPWSCDQPDASPQNPTLYEEEPDVPEEEDAP